jgi:dTDP-4-dehydrorhamnose reductase
MKLLIAGSRGQLGTDCMAVLGADHHVRGMDLPELDVTESASIAGALEAFGPDAVLNCAAFTNVDACESNREAAWRVNAEAPRLLAAAVRARGGLLLHLSTDYVFDGNRPLPQSYREEDPAGPLSHYGVTKLAGERAIQEVGCRYIILRTAWLYGRHGGNFPKTILRRALGTPTKPLRVVNDRYGSPTWSYRLALQIQKLITARGQGVYHATAEGYCSWFDFARRFLAAVGVTHDVQPCKGSDYPAPAPRPTNSILENARLKADGLNLMVPWEQDVDEFGRQHRDALLAELR